METIAQKAKRRAVRYWELKPGALYPLIQYLPRRGNIVIHPDNTTAICVDLGELVERLRLTKGVIERMRNIYLARLGIKGVKLDQHRPWVKPGKSEARIPQ